MADSQTHPLMEKVGEEESGNKKSGPGTTQETTNNNPSQSSKKAKPDMSPEAKGYQHEKDANVETGQKKIDKGGKVEMVRGSGNEQGRNGQKRTEQNQGTVDKSKLKQSKEENGNQVPQGSAGEKTNSRTAPEPRSFADVTRQQPSSSQQTTQQSTKQVKSLASHIQ